MKRSLLVVMSATLILSGCFGRSKKILPFEPEARRLGIVMPFTYKASDKAYQDIPNAYADQLTRALFDTKRLRVIDRQRLDTTLTELKLPVGVPLDSSQIATVCKPLKAEVAVYGNILSVQKTEKKSGTRVSETLQVTVDAKLVLAGTAEVLSSGRATGVATVKYKTGQQPPSEVLINATLAHAAKQIAEQLVMEILPK